MKRKLVLSFLLLILIFAVSCGKRQDVKQTAKSGATQWEKVKKNGKLVVATSGTLFPTSYHAKKGEELTGYEIEIIKEMAKRMALKVEFKELNVDGMMASVNNQTVDMAANDFGISKRRENKFILSMPYKNSYDGMIVRKSDHSGIEKFTDIKGKKAAGEASTGYMRIAIKYGAEPVYYDNATNDQYLNDVANGRTDVVLNDYYLQKMTTKALPDIPVEVHPDIFFNPSSSGILMRKGNDDMKKAVDKVLAEMKKDGTLKKFSEKFFDDDVSVKPKVKIIKTISADDIKE